MLGLLCVAALAGNILALLLYPDGGYLPASIVVLLACRLLGTGSGILVAMIANSYVLIFLPSPIAPLLVVAEAWVVGMLLDRGLKNLLLADLLYWLLFGALIRYLTDVHFLGLAWSAQWPLIINQVVLAAINALLATLLFPLLNRYSLHNQGSLSFLEGELNILAGCFLVPPLLVILVNYQVPRDIMIPGLESRLRLTGQRLQRELAAMEHKGAEKLTTLNGPRLNKLLRKTTKNSGLFAHLVGADQRVIASSKEGIRAGASLPTADGTANIEQNLFCYLPAEGTLRTLPETPPNRAASERTSAPFQIVLETPDGSRQQHLQQMTLLSLAALLLPAVPAVFILYRLDRRVMIPLQNLAQVTENLPEKVRRQEVLEWPTETVSECETLCQAMKESAAALQNSYKELDQLKESSTEMLGEVLAQHRWENFTSNRQLKEERDKRLRVEQLIQNIEMAETRYRFLIEKTMVGVFIVQDNRCTYVNPRFAEIFGYSQQEITDRLTLLELVHPDDRFMVSANNLKQLNGPPGNNLQYEFRGLARNGELLYLEVLNGQGSSDGQPAIIGTLLDITKRKQAEETIHHLAFHDPLTELPNRILFADRVEQTLSRARRNGEKAALLFIDLDRFKGVNDTLGHAAGDTVLKEAANRLKNCLRQSDTVSRFGGDEFNVLLTDVGSEDEVQMVAHKILKALEWPYQVEGQEIFLSGSIGIALYPKDGQDAMSLTKNADTALYRAKDLGRNNFQPYSSAMNSRALERMAMESSLRKVIDRQELRVHYQPQVDLQSGKIIGLEALMRWQHPTGRMIKPSVFIPLAEETGLIVPMGEWILRAACWQLKEWRRTGMRPLRLGVNVSSQQFQQANLTELVSSILQETGLEASQLNLEITETMVMSDVHESISVLQSLRDVGVTIAIDDFGTGFSSLSYLKDFPADHLKIDRAFVQNLPFSNSEANIARHIVDLAHGLGLKVIAEGVERQDQMDFLKSLGCDEIQGYLVSPPLPAEEILHLLNEDRSFTEPAEPAPAAPQPPPQP